MASNTATKEKAPKVKSQPQQTTRLLLALWELGVDKKAIAKGDLPDRAKTPGDAFKQLVEDGAIKIEKQNTQTMVSLQEKGVEQLTQDLKRVDFELKGTTTGAWLARGLLKWLQQMEISTDLPTTNGKVAKDTISSYDEFKKVALEVFEQLNRDYNMGNMVPIYRIRREIGDRILRNQFNEWLFEMQSEDLFELLEESVEDGASDKIEDSITTKLGKLRCYAKR
ncbi:hypothetical protein K9N68_23105 [Kovacikia minuta CCNUW1]|uniref:hypothetical protein n=1 Tax=Kovacikia minuta TaxID=2931930 RepID=UPI001CCE5CF2|nr:hypothetical protein [Kovacikia minuta]UBF24558.1 hypothetical protein K9N68_23105 [Kovacikia minuta CCNUW1]